VQYPFPIATFFHTKWCQSIARKRTSGFSHIWASLWIKWLLEISKATPSWSFSDIWIILIWMWYNNAKLWVISIWILNSYIGEPLAKIWNIIVTSFLPLHEDVFRVVIIRKNISVLLILKCAKSISTIIN